MSIRSSLVLALAAVLLTPSPLGAQQHDLDVSVGLTGQAGRVALSATWRARLGGRLIVGAGPRVSYYFGESARFRNPDEVSTALPSRLAIDPSVLGLNLMVVGELRLAGPVAAGANLDLAGLAAGPSRSVGGARLKPGRGSLFLYGDRDHGSLNSEFYVSIRPSSRWHVRLGMSHYVVGYRAESGGEKSRYLRFDTVPFVAVGWR